MPLIHDYVHITNAIIIIIIIALLYEEERTADISNYYVRTWYSINISNK